MQRDIKAASASFGPCCQWETARRSGVLSLPCAGASIDPIVVVTGFQADQLEKHISGLRVICLRNPDYGETQMYDSTSVWG